MLGCSGGDRTEKIVDSVLQQIVFLGAHKKLLKEEGVCVCRVNKGKLPLQPKPIQQLIALNAVFISSALPVVLQLTLSNSSPHTTHAHYIIIEDSTAVVTLV
jgi:hypothetical protein